MGIPSVPTTVTKKLFNELPQSPQEIETYTNRWLAAIAVKSPPLSHFLEVFQKESQKNVIEDQWSPVMGILVWRSFQDVMRDTMPGVTNDVILALLTDANQAIHKGEKGIQYFINEKLLEMNRDNPALVRLLEDVLAAKVPILYRRKVMMSAVYTYQLIANKIADDELEAKLYP